MQEEENLEKMYSVLLSAQKNKENVMCWRIVNELIFQVSVEIKTIRKDRNQIIFNAPTKSLKGLESIIGGEGKLDFFLKESGLVFQVRLKDFHKSEELVTSLPIHHMYHDRRERNRYELASENKVFLEINGKRIVKPCLDISSGGLSIAVSKSDDKFKEGQIFPARVQLGDKKLNSDLEVVSSLTLKPFMLERIPYAHKRISFKFVNMREEIENGLLSTLERLKNA